MVLVESQMFLLHLRLIASVHSRDGNVARIYCKDAMWAVKFRVDLVFSGPGSWF